MQPSPADVAGDAVDHTLDLSLLLLQPSRAAVDADAVALLLLLCAQAAQAAAISCGSRRC